MSGEAVVDEEQRGNATTKVLAVLDALGDNRRFADLVAATGLPKSSVHRILQDLVRSGFCTVDEAGGYLPGPKLMGLAGRVFGRLDALSGADPALERLRARTGATVHLAVLSGDEAIYVRKLEASKPYRMASRIGMAIPLYCTSIGKAVLAGLPRDEAIELVERTGQTQRTPNTHTTLTALSVDLDLTADRGWSLDNEENEVGVVCVGAAVRDATGRVAAAVSISQLLSDLDEMPPEVAGPLVANTAREVSQSIGWA